MANLSHMRSSVITAVTSGEPGMDFPYPNSLVDHIILKEAARLLGEVKGYNMIEPWQTTRFECQVVKKRNPECLSGDCYSQYYIDLSFSPLALNDDAGLVGVYLQKYMVKVRYISPNALGNLDLEDNPPSQKHPYYTRIGDRIYFIGGRRDFTKCLVLIDAAVGGMSESGLSEGTNCTGDGISVPIPDKMVSTAENNATRRILAALRNGEYDLTEDSVHEKTA